jgi:MSHA pilin protein MshD
MRVSTFSRTRHPNPQPNGFTLIEIIVTIIVTAIAFTAMTVWLFNANLSSVDPLLSTRAAELGQAYLEEILAKRFDENTASGGAQRCDESGQPACSATLGADAGETRADYDDVDDYHNLVDNGAVNALGQPRNNYAQYRVSISVAYAGAEFGLPTTAAKRIDVTVQHASAGTMVFSAYRGNF